MDGQTPEQVVQFGQDFARATSFQEELQNSSRGELRALVRGHETSQLLRIDLCILVEANVELVALALDANRAHALAKKSQSRVIHQAANRARERAITIFEFAADFIELRLALYACNPLVHAEALILFRDIVVGDADIEREIELDFRFFGSGLAAQLANGAFEHGGVELEADRLDLSTLFATQQIPR